MIFPLNIININKKPIILIDININNIKSSFLLDTGSSTSIIDFNKINKFTLKTPKNKSSIHGINKSIDSYEITIDNIIIGNIIKKNIIFKTIKLTTLNNVFSFNYIKTIDGIIGNDIIFETIKNIDFVNKTYTTY